MVDIPTIQLECKKDSIKQLQNGDGKLTLTVNAEDMNAAIASLWAAPMGTRYQVVMVEIGADEQPVDRQAESEKPKAKPPMTESQRCGMLCNDRDFQVWIRCNHQWEFYQTEGVGDSTDQTSAAVRMVLGVRSRKELDDPDRTYTRERWRNMLAQFEVDTGRIAERTR